MRKEYDFSNGERSEFYGKVDTKNPTIEIDKVSSPDLRRRSDREARRNRKPSKDGTPNG